MVNVYQYFYLEMYLNMCIYFKFADELCMPIICKHYNMSAFYEIYVTESPIIDIYNIP